MTNQEKTNLQKMISDGKIQLAIDHLLATNLNESSKKEVFAIAARYQKLKRQSRLGILSFEQQNITENQIITSLLNLIEHPADEPFPAEKSIDHTHPAKRIWWKYITAAAVIIGILGSLAEVFNFINVFSTNPQLEKYQLTIFVTDITGNVVLEHSGELNTSIGNRSMRETIGEDGRTNFGDILVEYLGDTIIIGFKAEGWEIANDNNTFVFTGAPIHLNIKRDDAFGIIKGIVKNKDEQAFIKGAQILINTDTTVLTDANGVFKILLPERMRVKSLSENYKLTISKDGFKTISQYFFPKTHAEISLQKQ